MRITNRLLTERALFNLQRSARRLGALQEQLSTGLKINRPSDDPVGVARALQLRARLAELQRQVQSGDLAQAWLNQTDSALAELTSLLQRAQQLAIQAANGTLTPADRQVIAAELDKLLEHIATVGNSKLGQSYLFAGFKTDRAPFVFIPGPPPTLTYIGDGGVIRREIAPGETIQINLPGTLFLDVFTTLRALRDDLLAPGSTGPAPGRLDEIAARLDAVQQARTTIGTQDHRVDLTRERLLSQEIVLTSLRSQVEDTDAAEVTTHLAAQETVYRAALEVTARASQRTLFDFLV